MSIALLGEGQQRLIDDANRRRNGYKRGVTVLCGKCNRQVAVVTVLILDNGDPMEIELIGFLLDVWTVQLAGASGVPLVPGLDGVKQTRHRFVRQVLLADGAGRPIAGVPRDVPAWCADHGRSVVDAQVVLEEAKRGYRQEKPRQVHARR